MSTFLILSQTVIGVFTLQLVLSITKKSPCRNVFIVISVFHKRNMIYIYKSPLLKGAKTYTIQINENKSVFSVHIT